jgi:hypothetical protein
VSSTIVVSEQVARQLESLWLGPNGDADSKLRALLEAEYRRRLARYDVTDRQLREKYGMTFEEFERERVVEKRGFTWEVESDAIEWETVLSGLRTVRRKLSELRGKEHNDDQ